MTRDEQAALYSYIAGKTDSHGFPVEPTPVEEDTMTHEPEAPASSAPPAACGECMECQTDSEPTVCPNGPPERSKHAVCACEAVGCPEVAEPEAPPPAKPCAKGGSK